ncbi:Inositol 2-dehydrogenase [Planctomycetes bacterium Pan216]|uniref:Inositol 2-dehydrogenase n=1 Tax=Kolteria novifilia TaxID=2527975 RepID=A0A518B8X6_9BACT|nr:Inositol 2-dehydrogenase [Planctomycetes bacterium Pan216]
MPIGLPRRTFLAASTAGLATQLLGSTVAHAASDTINIGCIGLGGRGRFLMNEAMKIPALRITTLCDVMEPNLDRAKKMVEKAKTVDDYRKVLDDKEIDGVIIATPDHWHARMTVDACEAGKDVYVEKPLTHDRSEGPGLIAAQHRTGQIVQVGMQQRSMEQIQKARAIIRSGKLGKIHKAHLTWNRNRKPRLTSNLQENQVDWNQWLGPAPRQPFNAFRCQNFRWFWDFGGGILTDLMTHHMDIVNWCLDLGEPTKAVTIGGNYETKDVWQTPDTIQTLVDYPDRELQVYFEGTFANARNRSMIELMGTEGTIYMDRGRMEVFMKQDNEKTDELVLGSGTRGGDFYKDNNGALPHLENWVECMRSRSQPIAPVEAGVYAVLAPHLGNRAYLSGGEATWVS